MAINYAQLTQAIQDYTEETETTFVNNIDRFITVTEDRILHMIQIPDFRKQDTLTTVASTATLAAPSDFLSVFSMELNDGTDWEFLLNKDINFMDEAFPLRSTGVPRFYGLQDDSTFLFAPVPDDAYSITINYYARPASIVSASTSWLGTNAENALLYGTLVEAYTFLKGEDDLLNRYQDRFNEAMAQLTEFGVGKSRKDDYRTPRQRVASI